jgi:uncharacterized membrane protein YgdD (TMEM256/DUF423 family)
MKKKRIGGAIAFALGVVLVIFSVYEKHRLEEAEGTLHEGEGFFSGSRVAKSIGDTLENRLGSYRAPLMIALIGGLVLMVGGASVWLTSSRKK